MTTFSLKDYYDNLGVGQDEQEKKRWDEVRKVVDEMKQDEDEYSGGIPIPFLGWAKINEDIDKEERESMLREQMHIVNEELNEAREIIAKQTEMLDLFNRFIKDEDLHSKWMFFVQDRKNV